MLDRIASYFFWILVGGSLSLSPLSARPVSCTAFMVELKKRAADLKIDFIRPVIVSQSESTQEEAFDLVSSVPVEGLLRCQEDRLKRFEVKISVPVDEQAQAQYERLSQLALSLALKWSPHRSAQIFKTLTAEAQDYLRASIEREDIYVAGKTEYHDAGSDMGMIWTPSEHSFVLIGH